MGFYIPLTNNPVFSLFQDIVVTSLGLYARLCVCVFVFVQWKNGIQR